MAEPHSVQLPKSVQDLRSKVSDLLGNDWTLSAHDHLTTTHEGDECVYSMACVAHYGVNLVVRINFDRGLCSILVGTDRPGDLYPFEDLAVHYRLLSIDDLHDMITVDPGGEEFEPPVAFRTALKFLSTKADDLNCGFAPENVQLRQNLERIAMTFRAAWDKAVD